MDKLASYWRFCFKGLVGVLWLCWCGICPAEAIEPSKPLYELSRLTSRVELAELVRIICAGGYRDMSLVRALASPHELVADDVYSCSRPMAAFNKERVRLKIPRGLLSAEDEAWLYKAYHLTQEGSFTHMSAWKSLKDPRDISFLHRGFATRPYLSARLMAGSPGPLVGDSWSLLATHMEPILLASADDEDHRLLAFAMARDGREKDALGVIETQLNKGDALALQVLPYVVLDSPQPIEDESAETTEPALGYQLVPMLENYLYQQQYPESFCAWAQGLTSGPLKNYVAMVLANLSEMLECTGFNRERPAVAD